LTTKLKLKAAESESKLQKYSQSINLSFRSILAREGVDDDDNDEREKF
jgi:hypothetical protein